MKKTAVASDWKLWDKWMRAQRLLIREIDKRLQLEFAVSKAEFSVLVTLYRSEGKVRLVDLGDALDWEKSRVSHQLTRMEKRGFIERSEEGVSGRRTGIELTPEGRRLADTLISWHAGNVQRYFLDVLSGEQAAAINAWSDQTICRLEPS
jgi:DNA-binding MarR family transcriptional regulator